MVQTPSKTKTAGIDEAVHQASFSLVAFVGRTVWAHAAALNEHRYPIIYRELKPSHFFLSPIFHCENESW